MKEFTVDDVMKFPDTNNLFYDGYDTKLILDDVCGGIPARGFVLVTAPEHNLKTKLCTWLFSSLVLNNEISCSFYSLEQPISSFVENAITSARNIQKSYFPEQSHPEKAFLEIMKENDCRFFEDPYMDFQTLKESITDRSKNSSVIFIDSLNHCHINEKDSDISLLNMCSELKKLAFDKNITIIATYNEFNPSENPLSYSNSQRQKILKASDCYDYLWMLNICNEYPELKTTDDQLELLLQVHFSKEDFTKEMLFNYRFEYDFG